MCEFCRDTTKSETGSRKCLICQKEVCAKCAHQFEYIHDKCLETLLAPCSSGPEISLPDPKPDMGVVYSTLLKFFNDSIELNQQNAVAWNYKGVILNKLGKNSEAQECFNVAKDLIHIK